MALSFSSSNVLLNFLLSFLLVRLLPVGGLEDALDVFLFEAVDVVGLDDFVDSDEGLLEGVERRRVDHLLLDLGRVRAPTHQEQFRPEMMQVMITIVTLVNIVLAVNKPFVKTSHSANLDCRKYLKLYQCKQ